MMNLLISSFIFNLLRSWRPSTGTSTGLSPSFGVLIQRVRKILAHALRRNWAETLFRVPPVVLAGARRTPRI